MIQIGVTFTTKDSQKDYIIIEKHKDFDDVWRCYPKDKEPPYKPNLIDCFSIDFIEKCLESN